MRRAERLPGPFECAWRRVMPVVYQLTDFTARPIASAFVPDREALPVPCSRIPWLHDRNVFRTVIANQMVAVNGQSWPSTRCTHRLNNGVGSCGHKANPWTNPAMVSWIMYAHSVPPTITGMTQTPRPFTQTSTCSNMAGILSTFSLLFIIAYL